MMKTNLNTNPITIQNRATFYYSGAKQPFLASDFNGWEKENFIPFQRISPDQWKLDIDLVSDAYIEYCIYVGKRRISDPLNSNKTPNGMGKFNNFFCMPDHKSFVIPSKTVQPNLQGTIERHSVITFGTVYGKSRNFSIYTPKLFTPETPLLIVLDGQDYLDRVRINEIVDYLIITKQIPPIVMALVDSIPISRTIEYTCSESNLLFLNEIVIPFVESKLGLNSIKHRPGSYGILGASFGGLFAVYAGLRSPQVYSKVISQSGAFNFRQHPFVIWDLLTLHKDLPFDLCMDVGQYEPLLASNSSFYEFIRKRSSKKLDFSVFPAGHNYPAWGNELPKCLKFIFSEE
ncbi:MAG: hypothetical protein CVU46_14405 [Chloroflexi bacterium HGW-Chloroflexi-8]|nr:MAG: hypothetical protein CVU46_14405 [Chloroflexi bacterium HGW-Chloroflexi-8]